MPNAHSDSNITFYIATPPTKGGVAVIHINGKFNEMQVMLAGVFVGPENRDILLHLDIGKIKYGKMISPGGDLIDEILLARPFDAQLALMCHGGTQICRNVSCCLKNKGLSDATPSLSHYDESDSIPGDPLFDQFLAGCLTSTQAATMLAESGDEGVPVRRKLALTHSLFTTQHVCLAGPPNAGKSSLLNRLSGFDRSFVHEEAGATRDVVCELVELAGYAALVEDLPGFSLLESPIQNDAWGRAALRLSLAGVVVFVVDAMRGWDAETTEAARIVSGILAESARGENRKKVILVLNKSDLPSRMIGTPWREFFPQAEEVSLCSLEGGDAATVLAAAFHRIMA